MAKAKGKEKPTASTVPAEVEEDAGDDVTAVPTSSEPVKMEEEEITVDAEVNKSEEVENPEKVDEEVLEEEEEVKEDGDGTVEVAAMIVASEAEKAEEGDKKEEAKGDKIVETGSNKKRKRQRKKKAAKADKPEASEPEKKKGLNKAEGLIFMCNSKTKKDCFEYKVFGLPESKKDFVTKVYKGMKLFLFDIDKKVMHGIYKAASPGGYNIEPKAFKSAFPSQVRFTVVNDCKPLPEEKFKVAIKANYSGKNRFNTELSREQVRDLSKLFMSEAKSPKSAKRADGPSKAPASSGRRDSGRRAPPRAGPRGAPYYPRGLSYGSPFPRPVTLLPPPTYAYERLPPPVDDYYHRERIMEPVEYRDPYMYREPPPPAYGGPYADPYREAGGYPPSGHYAPPHMYRY